MAPKSLIYAIAAFTLRALMANAQAPAYSQIPAACSTSCANTIEVADLCATQYSTSLDIYGCYCSTLPTDSATCTTCLNSNNAAALATLVSQATTACPQAMQACFFACSFDTCASSDIACQCSATYLENIFNCASCNSANGNTQATLLADFQALDASCKAQNYTGATQSFTTKPIASATGSNAYVAPSLTGTGGGAAATGSASNGGAVAGASTGTTVPSTVSVAGAASGGMASTAATSGAAKSSTTSASAAASTTSKASSASSLVVPTFGGIFAVVAGVLML